MYRCAIILVLAASSMTPVALAAQRTTPFDPRGADRPPAATLVQQFAAGAADYAASLAGWICPRDDAWRDSLLTGLMRLDPTPKRVARFAAAWSGAIERCDDSRLDAWFRRSLAATRDPVADLHLTAGLLAHRTAENLAAVRTAALDPGRDDETRSMILGSLIRDGGLTLEDRVELAAEVYRVSGRVPDPYRSDEFFALRRSAVAPKFRAAMLRELESDPGKPGALALLVSLAGDAAFGDGRSDPAWRRSIHDALVRIRQRPDVASEVRQAADGFARQIRLE